MVIISYLSQYLLFFMFLLRCKLCYSFVFVAWYPLWFYPVFTMAYKTLNDLEPSYLWIHLLFLLPPTVLPPTSLLIIVPWAYETTTLGNFWTCYFFSVKFSLLIYPCISLSYLLIFAHMLPSQNMFPDHILIIPEPWFFFSLKLTTAWCVTHLCLIMSLVRI